MGTLKRLNTQLQAELFPKRVIQVNKNRLDDAKDVITDLYELRDDIQKVWAKVDEVMAYGNSVGTTNLKLHDVSYYCYNNNISDMTFSDYCQDEFDWFGEMLGDDGLSMNHIGRTSSFYLVTDMVDRDLLKVIERGHKEATLCTLFEIAGVEDYLLYYDLATGKIDRENLEENMAEFIYYTADDIFYLTDIIENVLEDLETIKKIHDFINDYKENQMENFIEWYQNN